MYNNKTENQTLQRARKFIYSHLSDRICMGDLCSYTGVSLSTLERAFRIPLTPRDMDIEVYRRP